MTRAFPSPAAAPADAAAPDATMMVEIVFPERANHDGALFGGEALSLMAKAAFAAASRRARGAVVLARAERADLAGPVQVGERLELRAWVTRVGRSSLSLRVEGRAVGLDASPGVLRPALEGRFEMVAVDAAGRPRPIAPLASEAASPADFAPAAAPGSASDAAAESAPGAARQSPLSDPIDRKPTA